MPSPAAITRLEAGDVARLQQLLRQSGLPDEDCAAPTARYFGIFEDDRLIAAGGLQAAEADALLRSVVVDPAYRSRGFGRRISAHLLAHAGSRGFRAVYLLTETASDYFAQLGFDRVERNSVPAAIAATRQFSALCPDSAVCMKLEPV